MADNSWWKNSTEGTSYKLTAQDFDSFWKQVPDPKPYYHYVHPYHEKHKVYVRVFMGLKKTPTKKSCPLCQKSKQSTPTK